MQFATRLAKRTKFTGAILGLLAALVVLSTAAVVATTSARHEGDNAIHACVSYQTGDVRIPYSGDCTPTEREVDLAKAGVASDVVVINDENSPLPVAGNVEVSNDEGNPLPISGQVQAEQSGEWTVKLDGGGISSDLPVATKGFNEYYDLDPLLGPISANVDLPELIYASPVIMTSSSDSVRLILKEGNRT